MNRNRERTSFRNTRLQYARWEDLPLEVQTTFSTWTGGTLEKGRAFYRLYFYWYNIARQVGYVLRASYGSASEDAWEEEDATNRFAVAYWKAKGQSIRLLELEKNLRTVLAMLPDPVPPGQDRRTYFCRNYREIRADPAVFGYFQFSLALENLQIPVEFSAALRTLISPDALDGNTIPLSPDIPLEETLPYFSVGDMEKTLNAYGISVPEIQVICAYAPALQDIQWDA